MNPSRPIIFFQYDISLLFVLVKLILRSSRVPWCTPSPRPPNHSLTPLLYPWMLVTRCGRRADHTDSALRLRVLKSNLDFLVVFRSENLFECLLARKTDRGLSTDCTASTSILTHFKRLMCVNGESNPSNKTKRCS